MSNRPDDTQSSSFPPRAADPAATTLLPSDAATPAPAFIPPPTPPLLPSVPGYEVLRELARGGMGVVYQARQLGFNRLVALKMILSGPYAGDEERDVFRVEAEAVARLQHPNIVQVYEVGEHDGRPFFSMEFCPGSALDRKLHATPLPPKEAAALVETLSRAMQAAHDKGVIHRDLKPANVLLAEDGAPKVVDFGLARKVDEAGLTASGAVMGTPSYMAPEQARGKSRDIGPGTDVYALGAILYECLTGRPPFKGPTTLDTLAQVVSAEPVPPRQLQPRTPRDLETICLKCLEKQPGRRYGTARELAEDLRRFLAHEPIRARPVGRLERAAKWVRRRPAVAGFLALFVSSLVAGTAISTYFAVQSHFNYTDALNANNQLGQSNAQLKQTNTQLDQTNKQLRVTLADAYLEPLGHGEGAVNDIEIDALWKLAGIDDDRLRLLFVEQALQRPMTTRQLRNRADLAIHAVLGLDPVKRQKVEQALLARLRDEQSDFNLRTSCVLIGVGLDDWTPEFAETAARHAVEAMARETSPQELTELAEAVAALAPRMRSAEADRLASAAAFQVRNAAAPGSESSAFRALAEAAAALAPRLPPAEASATVSQIAKSIMETSKSAPPGPVALRQLAEAATVLAPQLEPAETGDLVQWAIEFLAKQSDRDARDALREAEAARDALTEAVAALAPRLDPRVAEDGVRNVLDVMAKSTDFDALEDLPKALAVMARRLKPTMARGAARQVVTCMAKTTNPFALDTLAHALDALAPRLDAADVEDVASRIVAAKDKATDANSLRFLAEALDALKAPRLATADVTRPSSATTRQVWDAMKRATGPDSRRVQAGAALDPPQGPEYAPAAGWVMEAMAKTDKVDEPEVIDVLVDTLAALIVQFDPEETWGRTSSLAWAAGDAGAPPTAFTALGLLAEASRPLPARLNEQQLVDLLKMPTCGHEARQVIVRQLGVQCGQPFANQWEFVEWRSSTAST